RAQIVDAVHMVGVAVRQDDGIDRAKVRRQELLAQIGRCIDQDARAFVLDDDRHAGTLIFRIARGADRAFAADQRYAARAAAAKHRDLHTGGFARSKSEKKLAVVAAVRSCSATPCSSATLAAVCAT